MRYVHTNLVAHDWRRLAAFYERVFGCVPVPPQRSMRGAWLDRGSGLDGAGLEGMHLRLPGSGDDGPTLEIYTYQPLAEGSPPAINRPGFGHIAFAVEDVAAALAEVVAAGGRALGEVTRTDVPGRGALTFVYAADPEGNGIELQRWD
jgi:predicted enzyme related to lactoylglutathione lyase